MIYIKNIIQDSKKSLNGKYLKFALMIIVILLITATINILIDKESNKLLYETVKVLIGAVTTTYIYIVSLNIAKHDDVIFPTGINILPKILKYLGIIIMESIILTISDRTNSIILLVIICIIAIYTSLVFSQYLYVVIDNENLGVIGSLKESMLLMKGNVWSYVSLHINFIPYAILSIITCGIYLFWAIPRIQVAKATFYLYLKENKINNKKEAF